MSTAYQLFTLPKQVNLNSSVELLAGAKAYFYATGTTTPQDTYSDSTLLTPNANPVVADAAGVFSAIYMNPALVYKLTLKTSADVTIYTVDPANDNLITQGLVGQALYPRTAIEISGGVTPSDYSIPSHDAIGFVLPQRYGAVGDGVTDDTTAVQTAVTLASSARCAVLLACDGSFLCNANITVPVGASTAVDIYGMGWKSTAITFTGAAVDKGLNFTGTALDHCGMVSDLLILCTSSAKRCVTFTNLNQPRLINCHLRNAAGCGVKFDGTLMGRMQDVLLTGCGSATEATVEVDGVANSSTTWVWDHCYISGGNTTVGGLLVDRTSLVTIQGGAIESSGPPIKIASKSETTNGCRNVRIRDIDLENPGNNPYIEIGAGLSGAALTIDTTIHQVGGTPAGTTTVPHFVKAQNFVGLYCDANYFTLGAAPTSCHEFVGTNHSGAHVTPHRHLSSLGVAWARYNGTQMLSWSPHLDCVMGPIQSGVPMCTHKGLSAAYSATALTGTTPSILISSTMGGFYDFISVSNGGATTVTSLSGGEPGMQICLIAPNANTTLTFGNSGGAFRTTSGANLTMATGKAYHFINDGSNGGGGSCWVQLQ